MKNKTIILTGAVTMGLLSAFIVPPRAYSSSLAEAYASSPSVLQGMVVSVVNDELRPASIVNQDQYVGIASAYESNLITLSDGSTSQAVTISGDSVVFASSTNGSIEKDDTVGISRIAGVVGRANNSTDVQIGVALEDFNETNAESISDTDGSYLVGPLRVRLLNNIGTASSSTDIFGQSKINGQNVPFLRVFAGLMLFMGSIVLVGFFSFAAIKSSFLAVGRNPLSRNAIYIQLVQVSTMSVAIITAGAVLAYIVWVVI